GRRLRCFDSHLLLVSCCFLAAHPPSASPLFPYTTLFRSLDDSSHLRCAPCRSRRRIAQSARSRWVSRWGSPATRRSRSPSATGGDRKSTRLNSSHGSISYAVFCLKNTRTAYASEQTRTH